MASPHNISLQRMASRSLATAELKAFGPLAS